MRLYDASSCTPCCSTWENAARQRPKPLSFVPTVPPSASADHSTENSAGRDPLFEDKIEPKNLDENKTRPLKKRSQKYQYLTKAPSNTTSTTGGATPPFDNTSHTPSSGASGGERKTKEKEAIVLGNKPVNLHHLDRAVALQAHPKQARWPPQASKPMNIGTPSAPEQGKDQILDSGVGEQAVNISIDVESSCSTLTTTRSMKLENQEACAISVASQSSKTSYQLEAIPKQPFTPVSILMGPTVRRVPIRRTGNISSSGVNRDIVVNDKCSISIEDLSPPLSIVSPDTTSRKSPAKTYCEAYYANDRRLQPPKTAEGTEKGNGTVTKVTVPLTPQHGIKPNASRQFVLPHLVPSRSSDTEDEYAAVKARLRNVASQEDRVDFFPVNRPASNDKQIAPRLGASGRFPSSRRQEIEAEITNESEEECWDPFHVDAEREDTDLVESSWVSFVSEFGSEMFSDSFPTMAQMEGFESKDSDNSITALLAHQGNEGSYEYEDNKENHLQAVEQAKQDPRNYQDMRKVLARGGGGGKSRKRVFPPHKPKLLGPSLEKRFTRSYWRRLRGTKKESHRISPDLITSGRATDGKGERLNEAKLPTKETPSPITGQAPFSEDTWWDAPHDENDAFASTPKQGLDAPAAERSDDGLVAGMTSEAKVLSRPRLRVCHGVLDNIDLTPDQLLAVIDTSDSSSPLTQEQIMNLHGLIPNPDERRLLLKYVKQSRRQASNLDISDRGEKFMLQLIGVEEVQRKLEALMFQNEFSLLVQKLLEDYRLLQRACEEIYKSLKLEKVLGIINMLGNRLVGKMPGRKKLSKISLRNLREMQAEAETRVENGSNPPFLVYAITRIQNTKPSLLTFKDDLPSLHRAVGQVDWEVLSVDLEAIESRFEDFRELAISLSSGNSRNLSRATMSVEDEIDILQTTSVGAFAVDACLRMAEIYESCDSVQSSYDALVKSLAEKDDADKPSMGTILATFVSFTAFVERFHFTG